jgi:hypothetical protein
MREKVKERKLKEKKSSYTMQNTYKSTTTHFTGTDGRMRERETDLV